ncbi:MAG TPA: hypothetical protein VK473_10670 [Terriglobales bacterium]|nr:hypothetical protein [Terriglobales bacterium]
MGLPKKKEILEFEPSKTHTKAGKDYEIVVTDQEGSVDHDYVITQNTHKIYWTNSSGADCWIIFPSQTGTPVKPRDQVIHLIDGESSRTYTVDARNYSSYKYTVTCVKGSNDPTIIVDQ